MPISQAPVFHYLAWFPTRMDCSCIKDSYLGSSVWGGKDRVRIVLSTWHHCSGLLRERWSSCWRCKLTCPLLWSLCSWGNDFTWEGRCMTGCLFVCVCEHFTIGWDVDWCPTGSFTVMCVWEVRNFLMEQMFLDFFKEMCPTDLHGVWIGYAMPHKLRNISSLFCATVWTDCAWILWGGGRLYLMPPFGPPIFLVSLKVSRTSLRGTSWISYPWTFLTADFQCWSQIMSVLLITEWNREEEYCVMPWQPSANYEVVRGHYTNVIRIAAAAYLHLGSIHGN